jgi:hypothetical protein
MSASKYDHDGENTANTDIVFILVKKSRAVDFSLFFRRHGVVCVPIDSRGDRLWLIAPDARRHCAKKEVFIHGPVILQ